jgi:hypothetical protein
MLDEFSGCVNYGHPWKTPGGILQGVLDTHSCLSSCLNPFFLSKSIYGGMNVIDKRFIAINNCRFAESIRSVERK